MTDKVSSLQNSIASKLEMLKKKMASKKKTGNQEEINQPISNVLEAESEQFDYAINDQLIEVIFIIIFLNLIFVIYEKLILSFHYKD